MKALACPSPQPLRFWAEPSGEEVEDEARARSLRPLALPGFGQGGYGHDTDVEFRENSYYIVFRESDVGFLEYQGS